MYISMVRWRMTSRSTGPGTRIKFSPGFTKPTTLSCSRQGDHLLVSSSSALSPTRIGYLTDPMRSTPLLYLPPPPTWSNKSHVLWDTWRVWFCFLSAFSGANARNAKSPPNSTIFLPCDKTLLRWPASFWTKTHDTSRKVDCALCHKRSHVFSYFHTVNQNKFAPWSMAINLVIKKHVLL
jgi:hypothetical protein